MSLISDRVSMQNCTALGPMAGVTDLAFRRLCKEMGVDLLYSEMVSAKAIIYHNQNTQMLLETIPFEAPIALQLFGSEPDVMAEAVRMVEDLPFDWIDVNMGCPVPKVVNNQEGSALMKDPKRAGEIVSAMTRATGKPVSVKIRLGFDGAHQNAAEVAKILEASGAAMLAVHGRTRSQYYAGAANWEKIREVKEAVSIPVIANGDVTDGRSARAILDVTGCDGVMVARAARGNPWIFREITHFLRTGELLPPPTCEEKKEMMIRHAHLQKEQDGTFMAVRKMRKHIGWYTAGMRESAAFRGSVNQIEDFDELIEKIRTLP